MRARDKPHLRYAGGVWSCASYRHGRYGLVVWRLGIGYTVREACADWKQQEFA